MGRQYRFAASYNTVNSRTIWQATNKPGGIVADYVGDLADLTQDYAVLASPVNNPLNARRPGHHAPGLYKRRWSHRRQAAGRLTVRFVVMNSAPHADIVERGKPFVRKRQVFSWAHARDSKLLKSGRWGYRPNPGGRVSTSVVHAWGYRARGNPGPIAPRQGYRVLERATQAAARDMGHRRSVRIPVV